MTDMPPIPDRPEGGLVRRDRLSALAGRVGPSLNALRGRPGVTLLLLVLFIGACTLFSVQWALNAMLHSRKEVAVPDIGGKNVEQSLEILSPLGLSLAKDGVEFDENFPAGAVLRQAPPAGLKVREGKVIRVTLSSGGKVSFVPEIVGKTLAEAQNLLRSAGMTPGALSQAYSQAHPEGEILEQTPAAGVVGGRGTMVDFKVSKGPPPEGTLLMPDFVNRPVSLARDWAEENKVKTDVSQESHPEMLSGLVVKQSPAVDAVVAAGQTVSFTVSASTQTAAGKGARWVRYQVPRDGERVKVRFVLRDERGETEVYNASQEPGSLVEVPVTPQGPARARIYVGGVLVEERVLE
jgi:serine/threonine-protein kinase